MRPSNFRIPREKFSQSEKYRKARKRKDRPIEPRLHSPLWNQFRQDEIFSDCIVSSADGKLFRSHRVLLATAGPYFRVALTSPLSKSWTEVKLPFTSAVVEAILDFVYTGTADVTQDNVEQVLPAADEIGLTELVNICCNFLQGEVSANNCWGIYRFAMAYSCTKLAFAARDFTIVHFSKFVAEKTEFLSLTWEELNCLLLDDKLNIEENELLEALNKWILHDFDGRQKDVNILLEAIRWMFVPESYFNSWLEAAPYKDMICQNLIEEARRKMHIRQNFPWTYWMKPRIPHTLIFIYGGWSSGSTIRKLETYDIRSKEWLRHEFTHTKPRSYHGMVILDHLLYIIGGYDGQAYFNTLFSFDLTTQKWIEQVRMNCARCYVSAVELDGEIYAIGGFNGYERMNSVEKYDKSRDKWIFVAPMVRKRSDAGAVACNDKIIVAGGFDGNEILSSTEMYDPKTNSWTLLPSMSTPRSGVSLVNYRGWIYALGGYNGNMRLNSCERLYASDLTMPWRADVPHMLTPRSNFCAAVLEDKLMVMGGFNGICTTDLTEIYNGINWYEGEPLNLNRSACAVSICSGLPNSYEYSLISRLTYRPVT